MEIETTEPVEQEVAHVEIAEAEPAKPETLRDTLEKAKTEISTRERDEKGKFKEKLKLPEADKIVIAAQPEAKVTPPPGNWKDGERAKLWATFTPEAQAELAKREEETQRGMTKVDEERQLGKQIKDVMTPYLANIQAEGGTPITAVQSLLNTAHILKTGTPQAKAMAAHQIIQGYGIDVNLMAQIANGQRSAQPDPQVQTLQEKLAQIENQLREQTDLQRQREDANVQSEIVKFQSDPANKYFEQVKPEMVKLLSSGVAATLQEAYQIATLANTTVRPLVLAEQAEASKRTNDVSSKKRAAVSVVGSSSTIPANTSTPAKSLRAELEANYAKSSLV